MTANRYQYFRRLIRAAADLQAAAPEQTMEQLIDATVLQEGCPRDDAGSAVAAVLAIRWLQVRVDAQTNHGGIRWSQAPSAADSLNIENAGH